MRSQFPNNSHSSLQKRDMSAATSTVHSTRITPSQETSDPSLENRLSILASNPQHIWQLPVWPSQPDYTSHEMHRITVDTSPHHDAFHPEISSNPTENFTDLNFSRPPVEEFLIYGSEAPHSPRDLMQKDCHGRAHSEWASPLSINPTYGGCPAPGSDSTMSPFSPAVNPSTPIGSAWVSVAGSAYGSLPNSSHGSASSPADSMVQATHYFAQPNVENSPGGKSEAPTATAANAHTLRGSLTADMTFNHKANPTDQKDRVRQDAHSKVEKRYRMNINSKIQQLKDILPTIPPSGKRPLNPGFSSRRRRSGAELSKRDILSLTITNMERLQFEVEQLTSLNKELTDKIAEGQSHSIQV
jgi:hypothetical protein